MIVGICVCELHLPGVRGLKGKRKIIKSLIERAHQRFRVSAAETDFHDLHQRAEIGLAAVGRHERDMERLLNQLREVFESDPEAFVSQWSTEFVQPGGDPWSSYNASYNDSDGTEGDES